MQYINGKIIRTEKEECVMLLEAIVNATLILDDIDSNDYHEQLNKFCSALYDRGVRVDEKKVKML
jgi:hypothetical protein